MKKKIVTFFSMAIVGAGLGYSQFCLTESPEPDQLSPSEIYARCYAKLTLSPLPSSNAVLTKLRSGTLDNAIEACADLLNKASLTPATGTLKKVDDSEARSVLSTMLMVHNSWFQSPTFVLRRASTSLIHDADEPGLYWTRALFMNGVGADSVVLYNKSLRSIRKRDPADEAITHFQARSVYIYPRNIVGVQQRDPLFRIGFMNDVRLLRTNGDNYSTLDVPDDSLSNFGSLIGIRDQSVLAIPRLILPNVADAEVNNILRDPSRGPNLNVDLHGHQGGGIMGSIAYGLKNSNLLENQLADDYEVIDRRFASRVFQDLLCYQLPVLNADDVQSMVNPNSTYPFQQNNSCLQCHATIDEFAMIQKNLVWASSSQPEATFRDDKPPKGADVLTRFRLPIKATSTEFALKEPHGTLRFRTFAGNKVEIPISNLNQVGEEFAKLDDFYTCAAKRYYRYFTGVDVPLGVESPDALERFHLKIVKDLGMQLKADPKKSLRNLVVNIFKTDAFLSRNYKTKGSVQ